MKPTNHEENVEAVDSRPFYARRNDVGFYTWAGERLPSVTTVLGIAPGQHLLSWSAKQAALKCASHLWQAGLEPPERDPALEDFCAGLVPRSITREAAVSELWAWQRNMRQAERYRDHKGRIGSVTHHAIFEHALGLRVEASDMEDYLRGVAIKLDLWRELRMKEPNFTPTEAMLCEVANSAHAYVASAFEWIETAQPEWEMIGQEAVVVRPDRGDNCGYAGTVDCIFTIKRSVYGKHYDWHWEGREEVRLTADFKTSNSLAKSVQAQVEAYAGADFIGLVATGETFPIPETEGIGALHIGPHASMAGASDEYGTLETKAKVIGAKFVTWPRSPETYEAFLGLCKWFRWQENVPKAHGTKQRAASAPRSERGAPRACPF